MRAQFTQWFVSSWRVKKVRFHGFPYVISAKGNTNILVQDLNLTDPFTMTITIISWKPFSFPSYKCTYLILSKFIKLFNRYLIETFSAKQFQLKYHSSFISKVKLVTLVKGDTKAPFSIATTPGCRGGHYSFLWIAPLYPHSIVLSAKQGGIKYHFLSLWYDLTWDWTQLF